MLCLWTKGGRLSMLGKLQQLGRALMLPMVILPAAAIFSGLSALPWEQFGLPMVEHYLQLASSAIFLYLPYIFAVGVALGLTGSGLAAGLAALVGMFIYAGVTEALTDGITPTVFIGILIGMIAGFSHIKFKDLKLPEWIQFFGGPRFVPLFVSFSTLIFAILMVYLSNHLEWLLIQIGDIIELAGGFGVFLYGFVHRILVIFGLHHIVNHIFWFQVGSYETINGSMVYGDLPRYFAGDPTAGVFMAGLYPTMMFALPAIAFAIIHEAREDLKPKVKKTFMLAALSSFLTGVTEPIEFAFLFVAPVLFVIHALVSGVIMWLTYKLGILHGFSFSAGAIDYFLNMHLSTNGWLIIPIGIIIGLFYYGLFRFAIRRFGIPTPGREDGSSIDDWAGDIPYRAPLILEAIGGKQNIVQMESCITRLRLKLHKDELLDINALRNLGAAGVIKLGGGHVQVVFGTYSELIREEMHKSILRDGQLIHFHSPLQGQMIALSDVPDPIFSSKMVGNGIAFIPDRGELVSPVNGKVIHIYPTMHAIGLLTVDGLEILLHIGIDTSKLTEQNIFEAVVKAGDHVTPGQLLIKFNMQKLKKYSKSIATPMVITNSEKVKAWRFAPYKAVKKGQSSILSVEIVRKNEGAST